jgi:site-specific DNA-methyltransferase (adenine-specific)
LNIVRTNYVDCCNNIIGLRGLPDNCIDLTVTSPPYDNLRTYKGFTWDEEGLIRDLYRVTKPGGVVVWIVNDATVNGSETCTSFRQALLFRAAGFNLHDTMIWKKAGVSFPDTVRYYANFEYMFIFSKGKPKAVHLIADKPNIHAGTKIKTTERERDGSTRVSSGSKKGRLVKEIGVRFNVWEVTEEKANKTGHPGVFPVQLVGDHIVSWSNPGDIVLDPFMGSGTTAVAAIKNGRKYIGFEIAPEYCVTAQQRINEAMEQQEEEDAWMF